MQKCPRYDYRTKDVLSKCLSKCTEELKVKNGIKVFQMPEIEKLPLTTVEFRQETLIGNNWVHF